MVYIIKDYRYTFRIYSRLRVTTRQLTGCAQANDLKILLLLLRFSDAAKVCLHLISYENTFRHDLELNFAAWWKKCSNSFFKSVVASPFHFGGCYWWINLFRFSVFLKKIINEMYQAHLSFVICIYDFKP